MARRTGVRRRGTPDMSRLEDESEKPTVRMPTSTWDEA